MDSNIIIQNISSEERNNIIANVAKSLGVDANDTEHVIIVKAIADITCIETCITQAIVRLQEQAEQSFNDIDGIAQVIKNVTDNDQQIGAITNVLSNIYKRIQQNQVEEEINRRVEEFYSMTKQIGATYKKELQPAANQLITNLDKYKATLESIGSNERSLCLDKESVKHIKKVFDLYAKTYFYKEYYIPNMMSYLSDLEKGSDNAQYKPISYDQKRGEIAVSLNDKIPDLVRDMLTSEDESAKWPIYCQFLASDEALYSSGIIEHLDLDCTEFSQLANKTILSENRAHLFLSEKLKNDSSDKAESKYKYYDCVISALLGIGLAISSSTELFLRVAQIIFFLGGIILTFTLCRKFLNKYLEHVKDSINEVLNTGMGYVLTSKDYESYYFKRVVVGWILVIVASIFGGLIILCIASSIPYSVYILYLFGLIILMRFLYKKEICSFYILRKKMSLREREKSYQEVMDKLDSYQSLI